MLWDFMMQVLLQLQQLEIGFVIRPWVFVASMGILQHWEKWQHAKLADALAIARFAQQLCSSWEARG